MFLQKLIRLYQTFFHKKEGKKKEKKLGKNSYF